MGSAVALDVGEAEDNVAGDEAGDLAPTATVEPDNVTSSSSVTTIEPATTTSSPPTTSILVSDGQQLADVVEALTPEEKAWQLIITGLGPGDTATAASAAIGSACPGGVFVNDRSGDAEGARVDLAAIRAAGERCRAGPLIMTDAEPGDRLVKVPIPEDVLLASSPDLYARYLASPDAALTELGREAQEFASALHEVGVDVNFGVPADVDVNDDSYMAREQRSFGGQGSAVRALAETLVDRSCAAGVAPTLKHFPNQGATPEDPHLGISTSFDDEQAWRARGRLPYVDTRAPVVMTGHIMMRDVDPTFPASLSFVHTTGLLRDDLGYQGVIVTDDLTWMAGVTSIIGDASGRAVQAIAAGADLALFLAPGPHDTTVRAIVERARSDAVFARRIDESVTRVLRLKAGLGLVDGIEPSAFPPCDSAAAPLVAGDPVVVVANGAGEPGLAGATAARLAGLDVVTHVGNAITTTDTLILHVDGAADIATAVAGHLGAAADIVAPTTRRDMAARLADPTAAGAGVWVVLGADHGAAMPPTTNDN